MKAIVKKVDGQKLSLILSILSTIFFVFAIPALIITVQAKNKEFYFGPIEAFMCLFIPGIYFGVMFGVFNLLFGIFNFILKRVKGIEIDIEKIEEINQK